MYTRNNNNYYVYNNYGIDKQIKNVSRGTFVLNNVITCVLQIMHTCNNNNYYAYNNYSIDKQIKNVSRGTFA